MAVYTAIDDPEVHFKVKTYTGTGSSNAITGVGFQPDLTWIKNRDSTDFHVWTNSLKGAGKYQRCPPSPSIATDTEALKSFDSDGFTVGTTLEVNTNTEDYVSWNWKAGTTTGIAGSPNITPDAYTFNQTAGFSLIHYTADGVLGTTIPHGLAAAPQFVMCKSTSSAEGWSAGHQWLNAGTTPWNYAYSLGGTGVNYASLGYWNNTAPGSTLVTFGQAGGQNLTGGDTIAYCFTGIQGFSKFGKYTGNGNADGPFVYLGFRPAWVMIRSIGVAPWAIYDDQRVGYNVVNNYLYANTTEAEVTAADIDLLSNGFKLRNTGSAHNTNTQVYTYLSFAKAPFVNSEGVPVNAR